MLYPKKDMKMLPSTIIDDILDVYILNMFVHIFIVENTFHNTSYLFPETQLFSCLKTFYKKSRNTEISFSHYTSIGIYYDES